MVAVLGTRQCMARRIDWNTAGQRPVGTERSVAVERPLLAVRRHAMHDESLVRWKR